MSYKMLAPLSVLFAIGAVAAFVRAQDLPTSAGRSDGASANLSDDGSPGLRSVLIGPTGAGLDRDKQDARPEKEASVEGAPAEEAPTRPRAKPPGLVDRLKEIRQAPDDAPAAKRSSTWSGATVKGPVLNDPASDSSRATSRVRSVLPHPSVGDDSTPEAPSISPSEPALMPSVVTPQTPQDRLSARRTSINPLVTRRPMKDGVLFASQGPLLRVETRGEDAILIGRASEFAVALINEGSTAAEGVQVRVALPSFVQVVMATSQDGPLHPKDSDANQQTLDWAVAQVEPGAEQLLKLTLKPSENRPFDLAVDWTLRPPSATAHIIVQKPELELALFGPKDMLYGKTAVFTIQITNPGSGPAEDVSLSFAYGQRQLPAKPIGTIAAGEQTEVDVELTAAEAGLLRIAATAMASGGLQSETLQQVQVRRGRLEVDIVGTPVEFAGSTTKYQVRVKNAGDATAADVVANVTLPQGASRVTASETTNSPDAKLSFRIGSLSPGAERVFTLACQLTTPGANRIEATARGSDDLSALQAFVTQVRALADLKLLVNDPQGPTAVGDDAIFEVRVMNRGTKAAEQINVVAQFSDGIEPVETNGGKATIVPGQVLFQPIPRIDAGAEIVLKVTARASKEGIHRFRAQVNATEPDTRLVAEESTYFFDTDRVSRTARKNE